MSENIFFAVLLVTCCCANISELNAQQKTLEQVRCDFGEHWLDSSDSIAPEPSSVIGINIHDSCHAENFWSMVDTLLPKLSNVKYLILSGTDCFDNSLNMIQRFLVLSKLNTIDENWGCIPSSTIFPEHIRQNLINLGCRTPNNENSRLWLVNLFQLYNIKDLSVFLRGDTQIDSSIVHLKKLERLSLSASGDIRFSKNFNDLSNLKEFTISHCHSCQTFPDSLPLSVEKISIYATGIKELCANLDELKNLKYLNIAGSKVISLPEGFNFSQLNFFGASEKMFTPEEWKAIEAKVGNVRKYYP